MGRLTASGRRATRIYLPITAGIILILWIWTILASGAPWLVVTTFWLGVGAAIALWVRGDMRKHSGHLEHMARDLGSALRRNAADVYDIRARAFAELEEIEDEGACYAFELQDNRLVFVSGQQFYASARFPSLDFSLAYVLNERDETVDMLIEKRGARAHPARTIPAAVKETLEIPDHLEVRIGGIDEVEKVAGPHSA